MADEPEPLAIDGELVEGVALPEPVIQTTHNWVYYPSRFQWRCVPEGHDWLYPQNEEEKSMPEPGDCTGCFRVIYRSTVTGLGFSSHLTNHQMIILDSIARAEDLARQEAPF